MLIKSEIANLIKNKDKDTYILFTNLIFALYFIFAQLGLKLATLNATVSPVWPATGIAIGSILFFGYRYLPAIFLSAFLTNYLNDTPLLSVFVIAFGNTLETFLGVYIFKAIQKNKKYFGIYFLSAAVFISSLISGMVAALIGAGSLLHFSSIPIEQFYTLWMTWWMGDSLGGIIVLPLIIIAFTRPFKEDPKITSINILNIIVIGLILSYLLFFTTAGSPFLFLVFPFLLYCVVKMGIRGLILSTLIISILGIIAVKFGYGVFVHGGINANYVNLQVFLTSVGLCTLILSDLFRASLLKKPSITLISTWLIVGLIYYGFDAHYRNEEQERFENLVDSISPLIDAKMNLYFSALQNGASLFAASDDVTREEWKNFINQGNYFSSLPALKWIGVVYPVTLKRLPDFIKEQKKSHPTFDYKKYKKTSALDHDTNANIKEHFIVTFVEPSFISFDLLGFDLASEKKELIAAELSRDTNRAQISDSVLMNTGKGLQANYIAFYPFYKRDKSLNTLEDKRKYHAGWIYGPINVEQFYESIFKSGPSKELSFKVFSSNTNSSIYSSEEYDSIPGSYLLREIFIGNQKFIIHIKRSAAYLKLQDEISSWTGALAAILSILLGTFIISLQSSRLRAMSKAEKSNEELKASEELLKFALEGSGDAVWDWEVKNGQVSFSPLFSKLLEYDVPSKLTGSIEELGSIVHPEDRDRVLAELFSIQEEKNQSDYSSEIRIRDMKGNFKWFLSRGMIVQRDGEGDATRMVGTISDISLRKQSEAMIENERTKFKAIFESSSDAIILFTEPWQILDCNNAAVNLFSFKNRELFLKQTPTTFSSMPLNNQGTNHFEWQFLRNNGETFPAEVALSTFFYNDKKIIQTSIRDISERKRYEDSLRRQREMLIASAKLSSLGEMAGGIAHEINNPLAIIIGKVTQLKRITSTATPEKISEEMDIIANTAKRIASIVKGLKSFSRNAEKDEKQTIHVPDLINDLIEISKERFKFHQINLDFKQNTEGQIYVNCRTAQLLQVLVNLLNNAFDAVEKLETKWVLLELETKNNQCIISVTDSGHGIESKIVEKLMTPFFTTKPVDKGTGLGLSISKTIIEEHEGKLYYDAFSEHTKFIIELPLASAEDIIPHSVH